MERTQKTKKAASDTKSAQGPEAKGSGSSTKHRQVRPGRNTAQGGRAGGLGRTQAWKPLWEQLHSEIRGKPKQKAFEAHTVHVSGFLTLFFTCG